MKKLSLKKCCFTERHRAELVLLHDLPELNSLELTDTNDQRLPLLIELDPRQKLLTYAPPCDDDEPEYQRLLRALTRKAAAQAKDQKTLSHPQTERAEKLQQRLSQSDLPALTGKTDIDVLNAALLRSMDQRGNLEWIAAHLVKRQAFAPPCRGSLHGDAARR